MPLSVGARLGPYEIRSQIGAGGMGDVYKAVDTRLDRVVAIKVSRADRRAAAVQPVALPAGGEREMKSGSKVAAPLES